MARAVHCLQRTEGLEVRLNELMACHTSLGVGGPAAVFVIPDRLEAVSSAVRAARRFKLPLLALGRGTNLLVRDGGFPGIVVYLGPALGRIRVNGCLLTAQAGATLAEVCEVAADAGLSGLEFAAGVPGSVGGAVAMNAGTARGQIADVIAAIEVVESNGQLSCCSREDIRFGYRYSCARKKGCVVVSVTFELAKGNPAAIRQAMFQAVESRCQKHPLSLGNCGSVFKRPPNDFAGRLLEEAGVKGLKIGGASFSKKHANFIVNEGNATAEDVVKLIETAKRKVFEHSGVMLEEEVCIVGDAPP